MKRKRRYLSAVALYSRLYAIGGYDASSRLNTVECFDPSTCQWKDMTPMLQRRGLAGATTLGGTVLTNDSSENARYECYKQVFLCWDPLLPLINRRRRWFVK